MDEECSVCGLLLDALTSLTQITIYIDLSCASSKKKRDFGLEKSFIMREISTIKQMQKYHQYFHVNGESLSDTESVVEAISNPKPKRFRKPE